MDRPSRSGAPAFRFLPAEVAVMKAHAQRLNNAAIPSRDVVQELAWMFSASPDRAGSNIVVQASQVLNWFLNWRRRHHVAKAPMVATPPLKMTSPGSHQLHAAPFRAQPSATSVHTGSSSGRNPMEFGQIQFEAKSARDGAWYDVAAFLAQRMFETGDPEVRVRFSGLGAEEDEWVNVRNCVRQRSIPCQPTECAAVLIGDLILCFQESKEHALYFDAHVHGIQRRRHDCKGCRCRFLVRYDHDQSEEVVPLRKMCRRPETDYRIQILHATRVAAFTSDIRDAQEDNLGLIPNEKCTAEQKAPKQYKMMDSNTNDVTRVYILKQEEIAGKTAASLSCGSPETCYNSGSSGATRAVVDNRDVIEIDD